MRYEVPAKQLQEESSVGYKPTPTDASFQSLPLSMLSDRDFEILCYKLVNREIESGVFNTSDKVALMQGVGDRGRDCSLYLDSIPNGVIQCKKYAARLTLPQVLKELIKLLLHSILDPSLIPTPKNFTYHIYCSNDCNEKALNLIYGFHHQIEIHIENGDIEKYAIGMSEDYETFNKFRDAMPLNELYLLLRSISVRFSGGSNLSGRISKHTDILQGFFNIRTVVDNSEANRKDEILKEVSGFLIDTAGKVLNRDYSDIYGEGSFLATKIGLLERIHHGIDSIEEAKKLMDRDLEVLKPIMDNVESELEVLLPTAPTIIIKQSDFFEDTAQLLRVLADCEAIDSSKPPKNA